MTVPLSVDQATIVHVVRTLLRIAHPFIINSGERISKRNRVEISVMEVISLGLGMFCGV